MEWLALGPVCVWMAVGPNEADGPREKKGWRLGAGGYEDPRMC